MIMGSSEMEKSDKEKEPKTPPPSSSGLVTSQEPSSAVTAGVPTTPDWAGFQAYSPMPHGYVASSPQSHPYMWQPMMPPYGTPPPHPYVAMYPPPGGMYAHPSIPPGSYPYSPYTMPSPNGMTEASGNSGNVIEGDATKQSDGKEKLPIKRSKGSLGSLNMIIGTNNETGKNSGASANGACSKSAESASDGSSEGSDANSQNDSGSRQNEKDGEVVSESGGSAHGPPRNGPANQAITIMPATGVPGPPTNLNIGMEYWSGHGNVAGTVPGVMVDGSHSQPWLQPQDERELKRQRRKQSNRESARRSRLRKQAECDELAQRAEVLTGENTSLRAEVNKLKSKYEELLAENSSLKNRLSSAPSLELAKNSQEPETSTHQDV